MKASLRRSLLRFWLLKDDLSRSFVGLQSTVMSEYYFSWDHLLTSVTYSFVVCVYDQPIVENWMKVDSSAFAGYFHKPSFTGTILLQFSLFDTFFVAFVVSPFEALVEASSIGFTSCFFHIV